MDEYGSQPRQTGSEQNSQKAVCRGRSLLLSSLYSVQVGSIVYYTPSSCGIVLESN